MLVESFADVALHSDVKLLLVGDGTLRDVLLELAITRGVAEKVLMVGAVHYSQVPGLVDVMDVCVIPDSNEYRSPIKLFEYMAMGKPVIAPDYEPITSVLTHGVDGVVFAKRDRSALTAALSELISNCEIRSRLGEAARATVTTKHLWHHVTQRIGQIYDRVVGRNSK